MRVVEQIYILKSLFSTNEKLYGLEGIQFIATLSTLNKGNSNEIPPIWILREKKYMDPFKWSESSEPDYLEPTRRALNLRFTYFQSPKNLRSESPPWRTTRLDCVKFDFVFTRSASGLIIERDSTVFPHTRDRYFLSEGTLFHTGESVYFFFFFSSNLIKWMSINTPSGRESF